MLEVANRPGRILAAVELQAATRAASGRYLRSLPVRPGVRYWATSRQRFGEDHLGVQFYGDDGLDEARRLRGALERAGFKARAPQTGQETFAKPVGFAADGGVDEWALRSLRRELDAVLANTEPSLSTGTPNVGDVAATSFRDFMLASPLAEIAVELPARDDHWRAVEV